MSHRLPTRSPVEVAAWLGHRHCARVKASRGGCSCQFGRASRNCAADALGAVARTENGRVLRVGGFVVGMAAEQGSNLRYRPKAPSSIAYTVTAGKKRYLGGPFRHRRLLGSAA
jgi:hypothetical protein